MTRFSFLSKATRILAEGLGILIIVVTLNFLVRGQQPFSCPPSPTPTTSEEYNIPYVVSYGFKAKDRKYGDSGGTSTESGTLSVDLFFWNKQLDFNFGNNNFVVGSDLTNTRALGFGNSSIELTYSPTKLQESTAWKDRHFYPSFSFDYTATLPTGNKRMEQNVGRVDHDITVLISKMLGKKYVIKNDDGSNSDQFARRFSVEADPGISFSANEGSGFSKTGNVTLVFSSTLGDIQKEKYTYLSEVDFNNIAHDQKTTVSTLNSLLVALNEARTKYLKFGLIAGLTDGTSRFGVNVSYKFKGNWKIKR